MLQQSELQGFISLKIPSLMKSRNFIPWRAWKRQWIIVRRSTGSRNSVELSIGRNSQNILQIFPDDIICRTESRTQLYAFGVFPRRNQRRAKFYLSGISETDSQKWISTIRKLLKPPLLPVEDDEFSVAMIDNGFSRSSGLYDLYGTLRIDSRGVTITDPTTSKNKVEWPWSSLSQFHVSSTIAKEDKGHICTVVTSRYHKFGVGQIHLFCLNGVALTLKLQNKARLYYLPSFLEKESTSLYRHQTISHSEKADKRLPSIHTPSASQHALEKSPSRRSFMLCRRLSRSEGNLMSVLKETDTDLYGFLTRQSNCPNTFPGENHHSEDKTSIGSNDSFPCIGKVAPGIISAGLGLILSTPGGSEGDSESLHEYQRLQIDESDEELTSPSFAVSMKKFSPPRRESGVSLASGVYEEIENLLINFDLSDLDVVSENKKRESPPPLPPRRDAFSKTDDGHFWYPYNLSVPTTRFSSKSAGNTPSSSPTCLSRCPTGLSSLETLPPDHGLGDCDYLPMSPVCEFKTSLRKTDFSSKESIEEQHYMVMASIKGT